jgi:hypothetical protein
MLHILSKMSAITDEICGDSLLSLIGSGNVHVESSSKPLSGLTFLCAAMRLVSMFSSC